MSNKVPVRTTEQLTMPSDNELKEQRIRTNRWFVFLVVLVAGVFIGLMVWVFFFATIEDLEADPLAVGANLTLVLAPIIAAAAGVERMLETLFNIIESNWKKMVAYLGRGLRWLNAAEVEVNASRQWLADVSNRYNEELRSLQLNTELSVSELNSRIEKTTDDAKKLLDLAKGRLAEAEKNLAEATSAESYRNAKAAATIVLGLIMGVIVSALGQLQMFAMLGIGIVPAPVDVFITGLVIGSGSYPVHSLLGILQQTKDTLDGAKGYLNRLRFDREVEARTRTVTRTPGEPPTVKEVTTTISDESSERPPSSP